MAVEPGVPVTLRPMRPNGLSVARFVLNGLQFPKVEGTEKEHQGASLGLMFSDDTPAQIIDLRVGEEFTVKDQVWRLDSIHEAKDRDDCTATVVRVS